MLLPQVKEREYRFRLALRIGLPIFALTLALISDTLITSYESISSTFYFESILLLTFSIYFILYLIYKGFDVKITDEITKTFSKEYFYDYVKKKIKKDKNYTLMILSIDNLQDIERLYGIKNSDKVLYKVSKWITFYLEDKDIDNYPISHIKNGYFIVGLNGEKGQYKNILELMCLRAMDLKIDNIEVKISGAITDTFFSNELDYLVQNLFELQEENKNLKSKLVSQEIDPTKLESFVIDAVKNRTFIVYSQDVFQKDKSLIKECFVKLKTSDGKIIHQKTYMKAINKLGLILDFDLMILEKNIYNCRNTSTEIFAMSISPTSLRNPLFLDKVKELINNNIEIKNRIIFLFSEVEYYSNLDKFNSILKSLREWGVMVGVDRLGSIHTSFLYLRDLDIDIIRFDSYYTKEIESLRYSSIVEGFNVMAHNKGVKTWIKMLENENSALKAKEIKIDYLQGKYLAVVEKKYENNGELI